eukprot:8795479-Karenia_brevis.AAC.1
MSRVFASRVRFALRQARKDGVCPRAVELVETALKVSRNPHVKQEIDPLFTADQFACDSKSMTSAASNNQLNPPAPEFMPLLRLPPF